MAKKKNRSKNGGRVDFLRESYLPQIKESEFLKLEIGREFEGVEVKNELDLFKAFQSADPTSNSKFLVWMLERFIKEPAAREDGVTPKRLIVEDLSKTAGFLDFFSKFNNKFQEDKRNINDYMNVDTFFDEVDKVMPKEGDFMSASQMERQFKNEIDIWVDNENWKVIVPKTPGAASAYGKGSRWCTTSDNGGMFEHYNKDGQLIILINKKCHKDDTTTHKFQFHFETSQFMNAKDESIEKSYLKILQKDKDVLNAFLKNVKSRFKFDIRLKLGLEIPEDQKLIEDSNDKNFTLNMKDAVTENLPENLEIVGNVDFTGNTSIKKIKNMKVHGKLILTGSSIEELEGIEVGKSLEAKNCKSLVKVHDGLKVMGNNCTFQGSEKLQAIPANSEFGGNLYVSECKEISEIPSTTKTKYGLYIKKTKFSEGLLDGTKSIPKVHLIGEGDHDIFAKLSKVSE